MSGRVLVTGGAGFIGSHIAEAYLAAGWDVTVLDDLSRGQEKNVPRCARLVRADIRSPEARRTLAEGRFDVLNHHAAQIDVRVSVDRPALDADINLVGFVNLLEGASEGGVGRVVFASSGGVVYGDTTVFPTPETDAKRPVSPYGVSKLAGEHYLRALGRLRDFEGVALRYSNVFGPRQDPKSEAGVVSIFVSRVVAGRPVTVFGDGTQTRDYVFVRDVAHANVLAGSAPVPSGDGIDDTAFNIATAQERTVLEVADAVMAIIGRRVPVEFAPPRSGELLRSVLDARKAEQRLGWHPEHRFEDGLGELVTWFREEAS
jgi:UDP-glucose 4-epimerase